MLQQERTPDLGKAGGSGELGLLLCATRVERRQVMAPVFMNSLDHARLGVLPVVHSPKGAPRLVGKGMRAVFVRLVERHVVSVTGCAKMCQLRIEAA